MIKKGTPRSGVATPNAFGSPGASFFAKSSSTLLSFATEPPDFGTISDASTVVLLKNLLKKDETTKIKAFDELIIVVEAIPDIDEAILGVWVQLYPRLVIDVSRRVRQQSHELHSAICVRSGKRLAKYMSNVIGPWLAALFDNEKTCAVAAQSSLRAVFRDEAKLKSLWQIYQASLLGFCTEVITLETVGTLSDERSVAPDDANAKYARVMANCLHIVASLLINLSEEDLEKERARYLDLFASKLTWGFSSHSDSILRKALFELVRVVVEQRPHWLSSLTPLLSSSLIMKALSCSQAGSVMTLLESLIVLTKVHPQTWTEIRPTKDSSAFAQLCGFYTLGSQYAPPLYWDRCWDLLSSIPGGIVGMNKTDSQILLRAILVGINSGAETKAHVFPAWNFYLTTCFWILEQSKDDSLSTYIMREAIWPVFEEVVFNERKHEKYIIPQSGTAVCASGLAKAGRLEVCTQREIFDKIWARISNEVLSSLGKRNVDKAESIRADRLQSNWIVISVEVLKKVRKDEPAFLRVKDWCSKILEKCLDILVKRKGNSHDCSFIVEDLLSKGGSELLTNGNCTTSSDLPSIIASFFLEHFFKMIESSFVDRLLGAFSSYCTYSENTRMICPVWTCIVNVILAASLEIGRKESYIGKLVKLASLRLAGKISIVSKLEIFIFNNLHTSLESGKYVNWTLISDVIASSGIVVSQSVVHALLALIIKAIDTNGHGNTREILEELSRVVQEQPSTFLLLLDSDEGKMLLSKLMCLTDVDDEAIESTAENLSSSLSRIVSKKSADGVGGDSIVVCMTDIITKGVTQAGQDSITLDHLVMKAHDLVNQASVHEKQRVIERLLLPVTEWNNALSAFRETIGNFSLGITNPLGSCIFLVDEKMVQVQRAKVFDSQGFSTLLRMAIYAVRLLRSVEDDAREGKNCVLPSSEHLSSLCYYVRVTMEVIKDKFSLITSNELWLGSSEELETEMLEFITDAQNWTASVLMALPESDLKIFVDNLWESCSDSSVISFLNSRVLAVTLPSLCEFSCETKARCERLVHLPPKQISTDNLFLHYAVLSAYSEALSLPARAQCCNEILNEILGIKTASDAGICLLLLLNAVLPLPDEQALPLPQPRIMFAAKHLLGWLNQNIAKISHALVAEVCRTLTAILPLVKGLYGNQWETILEFLVKYWSQYSNSPDESLPAILSSFKLLGLMRSFVGGVNDDINETWAALEGKIYNALYTLAFESRLTSDDHNNQPRSMCYINLARQVRNIEPQLVQEPSRLYSMLDKCVSRSIQQLAFESLHHLLPTQQEEISIRAALSDDYKIELPNELLLLISEVPSAETEAISLFHDSSAPLNGYLLSWVLVYDHFSNATFKVKGLYADQLRKGGQLSTLLDLIFKLVLGLGRKFDVANYDPTTYYLDSSQDSLQESQSLMVHVFYLALRYSPSLVKNWWLQSSRSVSLAVEATTERFLSPVLIDNELTAVFEWAQSRGRDEDNNMQIKVAKAVREVTASYPVDDQTMQVRIRIPETFPLRQVDFEGLKRIGLSDGQFKKMCLASQAVINFQSGSIIDALNLFSKNVSLHFQGISECAICYSILAVTSDRSLPNKACSTCKNKFHSTCLLKWFNTSTSSSCPLCRKPFSFYS